ncbi:hypothetical protein UPYG_G00239260 [Umbra pygmaea]|uniref:Uncharacterized protein n=1 Tax=Umbra pygmaea TaxID=75934 RepID=A0ABD0WX86_UMBPY
MIITNGQGQLPLKYNQWSSGICSCFDDCHICCFAFWCFPCFACNTTSKFGECFCLPLVDIMSLSAQQFGLPTCTPPPVSMSMRVAVRKRYNIQGDMAEDCAYSTFCNICSWCQMAREIKKRSQSLMVINTQITTLPGQNITMTSEPEVVITSQPFRQF